MDGRGGIYFVMEGPDGAGKSKSLAGLAEGIVARNIPHIVTREPRRDGAEGELIYEILEGGKAAETPELQDLIQVNREWHLHEIVRPALRAGKHVFSDRNIFSKIAYMLGANRELVIAQNQHLLMPDFWWYLSAPSGVCFARKQTDGKSTDRFNNPKDLAEVIEAYELLARKFPNHEKIETDKFNLHQVVEKLLKTTLRILETHSRKTCAA